MIERPATRPRATVKRCTLICLASCDTLRRAINRPDFGSPERTAACYRRHIHSGRTLRWGVTREERFKAALPHLVESMERHGHLHLDLEVRERLLAARAATLDRLLTPVRATAGSRRKRRRSLNRGRHIRGRTVADRNQSPPGFLPPPHAPHAAIPGRVGARDD